MKEITFPVSDTLYNEINRFKCLYGSITYEALQESISEGFEKFIMIGITEFRERLQPTKPKHTNVIPFKKQDIK
ncbi:MAG: hypothetical protein GX800_13005 [Clostridiaceae bacterium]|nr:hypothetical protein [Clostridiaceae bacterium]